MRRFLIAAVAGVLIAMMGTAFAVIGTTTITVTDGSTAIPNATVTITFKTGTGKKITTTRRRTPPSGKITVNIPDKTSTVEITVTARSCQRARETTSGGLFGWNVSVALRCTGRGRSGAPTSILDNPELNLGGGD